MKKSIFFIVSLLASITAHADTITLDKDCYREFGQLLLNFEQKISDQGRAAGEFLTAESLSVGNGNIQRDKLYNDLDIELRNNDSRRASNNQDFAALMNKLADCVR